MFCFLGRVLNDWYRAMPNLAIREAIIVEKGGSPCLGSVEINLFGLSLV